MATRRGKTRSKSKSKSKSKGRSKVRTVMREYKRGKLKSGSGGKVKNRKQAVAIALEEARDSGARIPRKKTGSKRKRSSRSR